MRLHSSANPLSRPFSLVACPSVTKISREWGGDPFPNVFPREPAGPEFLNLPPFTHRFEHGVSSRDVDATSIQARCTPARQAGCNLSPRHSIDALPNDDLTVWRRKLARRGENVSTHVLIEIHFLQRGFHFRIDMHSSSFRIAGSESAASTIARSTSNNVRCHAANPGPQVHSRRCLPDRRKVIGHQHINQITLQLFLLGAPPDARGCRALRDAHQLFQSQ